MSEGYNGWTNYPTWLVNVRCGEDLKEQLREGFISKPVQAQEYVSGAYFTLDDIPTFNREAIIYFLNQVNWKELLDIYQFEIDNNE